MYQLLQYLKWKASFDFSTIHVGFMVRKVLLDGVYTENFGSTLPIIGECGVAVGRDTALQAGRSWV